MTDKSRPWRVLILIIAGALWVRHGIAQDGLTDQGLKRIDGRFEVLEWRPGATADQYRRIAILDCYVDFRENWQRDQNRGKTTFDSVTAEDMASIKQTLAGEFRDVVTDVLEEGGAYEIVDVAAAPDLLLLRPAILNLDVPANIYGSRGLLTDTAASVSMTFYLELYDSATSTLIGRVLDADGDPDRDRAAARRVFGRWARDLRTTLEQGPNAL